MLGKAPRTYRKIRKALTLLGIVGAHLALIAGLCLNGIVVVPRRVAPVTVKVIDVIPPSAVVVHLVTPTLTVPRLSVDPPPEILVPADQVVVTNAASTVRDEPLSPSIDAGNPAPPVDSPLPAMSDIRYLRPPAPSYPPAARRAREQGLVVLRVSIDENGRVQDVIVVRSSGHPRLDEAAKQAVTLALFKPYTSGGLPRAAVAMIPIEFSIHG